MDEYIMKPCIIPGLKYPFRFCGKVTVNPDQSRSFWTYPLHTIHTIRKRPEFANDPDFNKENAVILDAVEWEKACKQLDEQCIYPTPIGNVVTRCRFDVDFIHMETVFQRYEGEEEFLFETKCSYTGCAEFGVNIFIKANKQCLGGFLVK